MSFFFFLWILNKKVHYHCTDLVCLVHQVLSWLQIEAGLLVVHVNVRPEMGLLHLFKQIVLIPTWPQCVGCPGRHRGSGHGTQGWSHLAQTRPGCRSSLGDKSKKKNCLWVDCQVDCMLYLVCGSEWVFSGHILDVVGQCLVGKDVGILVYFVHSIFESQFSGRILNQEKLLKVSFQTWQFVRWCDDLLVLCEERPHPDQPGQRRGGQTQEDCEQQGGVCRHHVLCLIWNR